MKLPISFDEVSYFNGEYRGDLIVTEGVLYYFPHTRVAHSRRANHLGGKENAEMIGFLGELVPLFAAVPWIHASANAGYKVFKFMRRSLRPTTNSPHIVKKQLWNGRDTNAKVQQTLDEYIQKIKLERLEFDEDSVPKPMRFAAEEMENTRLQLKFRFNAKFDTHDFKANPLQLRLFKKALNVGGFLK